MAPRNTISRLTSRIDELTERLTPERGLITIVGGDQAECQVRLEEIEAAGELAGRQIRFIMTGVKRAESFGRRWSTAADPK
jgi:hypothetical protein